ncbi:bifunctional precorrin-2 dehydrogenase/sirohydrochlorin ferrochelatase [bacterium]|nr:bifunctional precorrin-2 dehydrogenase/sirohydrochlorin ferrochelatase [bacterium]
MSDTTRAGYYPLFLDLNGRLCKVVGAGKVARRKIEGLLEAGARLEVISPAAVPEVESLAAQGKIAWVRRAYHDGDLEGAFLVIGATPDRAVNAAVFREAESRHILVNVVDDPQYCNFILASVLRRGDFQLAVSTGGASPVLSRKVRERLESLFPEHYTRVTAVLSALRERVKTELPEESQRRRFWESFIDLDFFASLDEADLEAALDRRIEQCLSRLAD